jgi:hypothetical protein
MDRIRSDVTSHRQVWLGIPAGSGAGLAPSRAAPGTHPRRDAGARLVRLAHDGAPAIAGRIFATFADLDA